MHYQITPEQQPSLLHADTVPAPLKKYLLPGSSTTAGKGEYGYFLLQQLSGLDPNTSLWYNNYLLEQEQVFCCRSNEPHLCLQFALSNNFHCRTEGGEEWILQQGSFNIYYHPVLKNEMSFRPGRLYSMISVYFPYSFLESWVPYFPALTGFMEKVNKQEPAVLCSLNQAMTSTMDTIIQGIIRHQYPDFAGQLFMSIKITELLLLAMEKVIHHPTTSAVRMRKDDIQRMHEVKEILQKNLEHPLSLHELSRRFGINVKKLKMSFKAIYEKSPFDFLLDIRMEKARELLVNSDMNIEDIGESVGYSDKHSFSKAFKQYNGCPPASYRRNMYRAE